MSLKFAANLNFLFNEGSLSIKDKIILSSRAGYRAVEIPFSDDEITDILQAKELTGIEISLINIATTPTHKYGCASVPGTESCFKECLDKTIAFAKRLACKKIHIMSGLIEADFNMHLQTYIKNLKYANSRLEEENIIGLIEPINETSVPSYFLNSYRIAQNVLKELQSKNLKLLMDVFHLQRIQGNISQSLSEMSNIIGHIQIAQAPHRHEPDVLGELDFDYIFSLLKKLKYDGWVGCEYIPQHSTIEGLKWIHKYGFKL